MQRRQFLKNGIDLAIVGALPSFLARTSFASGEASYLVSGHAPSFIIAQSREAGFHFQTTDTEGFIRTMNLQTGERREFPAPLWAHSCTQHPLFKNQILAVAKWTHSAIVMDLRDGKILKRLSAPTGYRFFGHSIFDSSGKRAYISANAEWGAGVLCIYNAKTWQLEEVFNTQMGDIHECIWLNESQILVRGGTTGIGYVTVVDTFPLRVVKSFRVSPGGHLLKLDENHIAISGGTQYSEAELGMLNLQTGELKDAKLSFPKESIWGETLSLAKISEEELAATITRACKLLIWNFKTNKSRFLDVSQIGLGTAVAQNNFYLTYGLSGELWKTNLKDLKSQSLIIKDSSKVFPSLGNGKHINIVSF